LFTPSFSKTILHGILFPNDFFNFPGIIAVREWSGCLSHEKEHQMRDLGCTEIHSANLFCMSGHKSRSRAVGTANKLKAHEKQTKHSQ
jgi:hypothetical protein